MDIESSLMANKKTHSVLIVEDESSLNEAYQLTLNTAGFDIYTAFDGEEALSMTEENDFDVILLDLRMPILDGIGFLKGFKEQDKKHSSKIIVFSNFDMQKEIEEAYELGADKYVLKSWASPKELVKLVQDAVN